MNKIKKLRKEKKLTQMQLAEKMGTSSQTILNWENGFHNPSLENYVKLAEQLGCSLSYLINEKDTNYTLEEVNETIDKIPFASIIKSYLAKKN